MEPPMDTLLLGHAAFAAFCVTGYVLSSKKVAKPVDKSAVALKQELAQKGLYLHHRPLLQAGGGISGCCDWQTIVVEKLSQRRANFDVSDTKATEIQIKWEHEWLRQTRFPHETLCPITLYELGTWTILSKQTNTKLFVGCHPEYKRKEDVIVQTQLVSPDIKVVESIEEIIDQIEQWYKAIEKK